MAKVYGAFGVSRKEGAGCSCGPHNFGPFSVFFLVFAKIWDSPQKMAGGPFQNGSGLFVRQQLFYNTNYQLKNLKKYSWIQRVEFYRLIFF